MIRFSIITVTFNAEQTLERTLASVCGQTYEGIEYIVVDGASSDGTLALIAPYRERIACLVSEPDRGLYDAMNKGLQQATGDYVWFINAGDTLPVEDTVARLAASLPAGELPDILYGETVLTDSEGHTLGMRRLQAPEALTWQSFRHGMLVSHQAFIVRRTQVPAFDLRYRYSSDIDWCIRCLRRAHRIYNVRSVLCRYLDGGLSTQRRRASLLERFRIQSRYYGLLPTLIRHVWFAVRFALARKRNYVPLLVLALLLYLPDAWGQTAEELLDRAAALYAHPGGVSVSFAVHSQTATGEESFAGRLRMQGKRFALSTPELRVWYDGRNQWTYWAQSDEVTLSQPTGEELRETNPALILQHRSGYVAKLAGETFSPDGRPAYAIDLVPRSGKSGRDDPSLITVQIEKATSLPARIQLRTPSGGLTTVKLQSFKSPLAPQDTFFTFQASFCPSAPVIDIR
jgi:glycosyltransferase involved in cell wall biosynthesis/outer membrane lipoprotein-sorting protein